MVSLANTGHRNGEAGRAYRKDHRTDDGVAGNHRNGAGGVFDGHTHHDRNNRGDRVENARGSGLGDCAHVASDAYQSHPLADNHGALGNGNGTGLEEDDRPRVESGQN